jgi:shikimate dehydrogenase
VFFTGKAELVGIIGHPVGHSLSPRMHNAAFAADGLDFVYVPMDVEPDRLPTAVEGLRALGFRGFNVTMPHKRAVVPLLDELDVSVRVSGAANTVVLQGDAARGANTDGVGFVDACRECEVELAGRRVMLVGAGGAAAAVAVALLEEGIEVLHLVNRTAGRAEQLRRTLREAGYEARIEVSLQEAVREVAAGSEVLVNSTYLGMKPDDPLPIPEDALEGKAVCDAVYVPVGETGLIHRARERGCRVVPGGLMLLHQGVRAQALWTGREPNVEAMRRAIF